MSSARLIRDIYSERRAQGRPTISFEFFPPKTPKGEASLFDRALPRLLEANPHFCSVTYGAGGSTHDTTLEVVDQIQRTSGITGMAHLTCIASTREQIQRFLRDATTLGIRNILALRGDPPRDAPDFAKPDNGFDYSYQLIDFIRTQGDFSIGTAGFPESHTACTEDKHVDWQRLKAKIEHGANFVLTQLFFDNADYFEFLEYMVTTLGVTVPLTPGVLPILSTKQIKRFAALCGAALPGDLVSQLDELGDDDEAVKTFGVKYATPPVRGAAQRWRSWSAHLHAESIRRLR